MKANNGVTLINMMIIVVILIIISAVSIIGGTDILKNSKDSKKEENLAAVQTAVNQISIKQGTEGVFTPANSEVYGNPAKDVLSGDSDVLADWYILDEDALKEMGIEYVEENYIVNYKTNTVYSMSEYNEDNSIIE